MPRGYDLEMNSAELADGAGATSAAGHSSSRRGHKSGKAGRHTGAATGASSSFSVAERAQQQLEGHASEEESRRVSIPLLLVFVALLILIIYVIYLEFIAWVTNGTSSKGTVHSFSSAFSKSFLSWFKFSEFKIIK